MKTKIRTPLAMFLGSVIALLIAAASFAPASGETNSSPRVSRHGKFTHYRVAQQARQSASAYWTPARMAAAEPRGVVLGHRLGRRANGSMLTDDKVLPGFIPGDATQGSVPPAVAPRTEASGAAAVGYNYPFPFSRFEIPGLSDYTDYPYSAVGKIFGTDPTGDYVCSGAAVVSANESVVWTAGHCAFYTEGWFTNLIFVPAYRDSSQPFGEFVAMDAWITNAWLNNLDSRSDVAAIIVDTAPTGGTLADTVGDLGFAWSAGRLQHWESFGYPAQSPFNGMRQQVCAASFAANDPFYRRRPPLAIGCDMTPGSSGGPWILDFGHGYYINGVNSYILRGLPDAMFSPYFGAGMASLLGCAEDGVC